MSIEITMPRLSDTMEAGTVIKWIVSEGDEVSSGQAVADIETDKATMEMQVYDDGVMAGILVPEGQQVDVGTVIGVLAEDGEDVAEVRASAAAAGGRTQSAAVGGDSAPDPMEAGAAIAEPPQSSSAVPAASPETNGSAGANGSGRLLITPVARRIADEHGLDVRSLRGSGPGGRIIKRDVLTVIEGGGGLASGSSSTGVPPVVVTAPKSTLASAPPARPFEPGDQPLSNMRQTIARRLVESKTSIPHYQVTAVFNMDPLLELRATLNEQLASQGVKLSVNDFLVRGCATAIRQHPEFNGVWGGDKVTIMPDINIGVAIALPPEKGGGLVVATIRNADQQGLRQISEDTRSLAQKARTRGLNLEDMSDSTFTISNLGMFGVEHFTAIINPPNAAILAVGAAVQKPVVRGGEIVVGHEMQATLSLDHRIIDGAMAAQYLQTLKQLIENPATLLV